MERALEEQGGLYASSSGGLDQPDYALEQRIRYMQAALPRFQNGISGGLINHWMVLHFETNIQGSDGISESQPYLGDERWVQLMDECRESVRQAWELVLEKTLQECSAWAFKNIASVTSMMTDLEHVVGGYTQHRPLTDDLERTVRAIKERGARFRWAKKIGDAEVAEAAGYVGKAAGLRKEAKALLVRDWAMVFKGEEPPNEEPPKEETVVEEEADADGVETNAADIESDMSGYDVVMPGHEPEIMLTTVYCPDCNMTYELEAASYPGGRESALLTCPDCEKLLGGSFESDWTVEKRTEGDTRKKWSVGPPRIF